MNDVKIIALCGFIGSGKDTVGDYLVREKGYTKISFASALKDVLSVIFGWDRKMLEGLTPEDRAKREDLDIYWSNKLEREVTPRNMMFEIGTKLFRENFKDDIWVSVVERQLFKHKKIVITDCRFINEIDMVKNNNGKIIRIYKNVPEWFEPYETYKSEYTGNLNISETEWIRGKFDHIIENDSSINDLYRKINEILEDDS